MTVYRAHATRQGKWWMVRIPEFDGLTQARRLGEAGTMAREWIALARDLDLDQVEVDLTFEAPGGVDVEATLSEIVAARDEAARLEAASRRKAEELAKQLAGLDVPVRDIGTMMGVSFQRAHQLISA